MGETAGAAAPQSTQSTQAEAKPAAATPPTREAATATVTKKPETPQAPAAERVDEAMTQARAEATSAANLDHLLTAFNVPIDKQNPQAIQKAHMGLMKLSKILGAVILALLGFGVWRGFKEMNSTPQG